MKHDCWNHECSCSACSVLGAVEWCLAFGLVLASRVAKALQGRKNEVDGAAGERSHERATH